MSGKKTIHISYGQREENFSWDSSSIILKWIFYTSKQTNLRYRNTEYNYILYA